MPLPTPEEIADEVLSDLTGSESRILHYNHVMGCHDTMSRTYCPLCILDKGDR